jgi:adenylate cyclase
MGNKSNWTDAIENVLDTTWDVRNGTVIPETEGVVLKDGAVKIEATFLYADLAGSSKLAEICPWSTTAKIIRAYLDCCVRAIKAHGGKIRSFDGDRVMGVFIGERPNTAAANCAREIDWMVEKVINPKAKEKFESVKKANIHIQHCVGIDTSEVRAVRTGIRENNDLIWIGRAPSLAAKFSDIREYPYAVYISSTSYSRLNDSAKKLADGNKVWEEVNTSYAGNTIKVYRTKYILEP